MILLYYYYIIIIILSRCYFYFFPRPARLLPYSIYFFCLLVFFASLVLLFFLLSPSSLFSSSLSLSLYQTQPARIKRTLPPPPEPLDWNGFLNAVDLWTLKNIPLGHLRPVCFCFFLFFCFLF